MVVLMHTAGFKHLGLARSNYTRCTYGVFGRNITYYMVT